MAVLYRKTPQDEPARVVKLKHYLQPKTGQMSAKYWEYTPATGGVTQPDGRKDRFYNGYMINEDDILIV